MKRLAPSPHRPIGLFGGTFNPIHIGHIKMAEAARKEYKLHRVYFIPCGVPPHKSKKDLLSAKIRYELVKKAIKGKKYFKVLDVEIKKRKPCYTIDTIRRLAPSPHRRLFFLIGQDEFEKLHTWNKPGELAKLVTFLVLPRRKRNGVTARFAREARRANRPAPTRVERGERVGVKLPKVKNLKWHMVHTKPVDVSASKIRNMIVAKCRFGF